MALALGGVNLRDGKTRLPLPLGMLAQPLVDGVTVVLRVGEAAQAPRRIAAEILVVGVRPQRRVPEEVRVGVQALLRTPGEETPARTQVVVRALGVANRGGEVQTHKPMDGTCNSQ